MGGGGRGRCRVTQDADVEDECRDYEEGDGEDEKGEAADDDVRAGHVVFVGSHGHENRSYIISAVHRQPQQQ